jgi:ubiquinone/menaquinone biosynthesis C-methylase UbiE
MTLQAREARVGETAGWLSAHYEQPFYSRRVAKLPAKLAALGVLDLPREAHILDTCCGKGEALALLRQYGFRSLTGADGCRHAEWGQATGITFAACDVRQLPFADGTFDAVLNLHALHHLGDARGVAAFLGECARVLKPGGRLFILDFPSSLQIRLAFWALKQRVGAVTPGLRNFARILDEEWDYLMTYLADWPAVQTVIQNGPLQVEHRRHSIFLYYLTLWKPIGRTTAAWKPATPKGS